MRNQIAILLFLLTTTGCGSFNPRPWTKAEKQAAIYFLAAHTANAYTTVQHQGQPDRYYETNPIMGRHPSDREINTYFSVTGIGTILIAHLFPEIRERLLVSYGNANTMLAFHDCRMMGE
jgi:hypothetical protein